jgi:hypothetical protein
MTITSRDGLIDAMGNGATALRFDKANIANAVAGQLFSLWRATGIPGQGAIPGAAAVCNNALLGALGFTNPTAPIRSYLARLNFVASNAASSWEIHDRLAHMGGLNGTLLTAQTVNVDCTLTTDNLAQRIGDANYSDVQWWLEWYTDTGATASNATVNVDYDDGSSGNLAVIAVGGTVRAGRLLPLIPAVAGRFIRKVNNVTLSASTGAAGSFGVTATRRLTDLETPVANFQAVGDWARLGLPRVFDSACLQVITVCGTTSTGTLRGGGRLIQG